MKEGIGNVVQRVILEDVSLIMILSVIAVKCVIIKFAKNVYNFHF
jgi:hypothetical protein